MRGAGVNRRPTLPLLPLSIAKNFGIRMPHAGSSTSARKPTKQRQKDNAKRPKKSVLSRQTVELLDKTALEYVGVRGWCTLHMTLIEATPGPRRRPQGFLGFANIGPDEERAEEGFLRRDDGYSNPESANLSQGQGCPGCRTDREWKDLGILDTCSRDSLSPKMGTPRWSGSSRDFSNP